MTVDQDLGQLEVQEKKHDKKHKYPKQVFFVIGNEFCERFSFYGMKTILTLYLRNELSYDDDAATVVYHTFNMFCYFTPILGAVLADSLLGKFRTIFYISVIYCLGNVLLSMAATPTLHFPQVEMSLLGLALIALGTGGIKPCVAAFGGDQFVLPQQELQLQQFFSIFYFSINAGSLISTVLTPILRNDVHCFGSDSCYPLAFGVPAVLMIIALVLFLIGKPWYKCNPPQGNVVMEVSGVITHAVSNKLSSSDRRQHWLDHADDRYSKKLISDVKAVLNILFIYIPIPIFWALFDQQGSRWTLQATQMNGEVGSWLVLPDQLQVVNPLLILALIPIFQTFIYPGFAKFGMLTRPLQRMIVGGLLAVLAFVIAALIEMRLESLHPELPTAGEAHLRLFNTLPCQLEVTAELSEPPVTLPPMGLHRYQVPAEPGWRRVNYTVAPGQPACPGLQISSGSQLVEVKDMESTSALLVGWNGALRLVQAGSPDDLHKDLIKGYPKIRILYGLPGVGSNSSIALKSSSDNATLLTTAADVGATGYTTVYPGEYSVYPPRVSGEVGDDPAGPPVHLRLGASYSLVVTHGADGHLDQRLFTLTEPNSLHMFWLIPQYFVITVGEVMFSITGLEFSFTQAPSHMKSVLQAAWLLTISFGNLLDVVIVEMKVSDKQSHEFFFFAGLMLLDMLLFAWMASRYRYVEDERKQLTSGGSDDKTAHDADNPAFQQDVERDETTRM